MTVPDPGNYRKDAVSGFLRDRRARRDPDPASPVFDPVSDRRVAGMRREEVAWAAGISMDYYVKLEQGRMLNPSPAVLENIMDALRLSDLDRRYLGLLFGDAVAPVTRTTAQESGRARSTLDEVAAQFPDATMRHLLDRDLGLVLADARTREIMFPGSGEAPSQVSLVDYMFSPAYRGFSRRVYVDWRDKAAEVTGLVHMKMATGVATENLVSTVARLLGDPAFRRLWTCYEPYENTSGSWRVSIDGRVRTCRYITVTAPDDPEQSLVIYR